MSKLQLHKRFTTEQVKMILQWYEEKALTVAQARERLELGEDRFFKLLKKYRESPETFSVGYPHRNAHNRVIAHIDDVIRRELEEKSLIDNPAIPLTQYNYAAIRDEVVREIGKTISDDTIRNRARAWGFIQKKKPPRRHDRVVLTTAAGMLFQHDASRHLWTPYAKEKWSLITTLDDYSRKLLYADLWEEETTWAHIQATESVILTHGKGLAYYVDNHSIFRFVCYRDSIWKNLVKGTDDVMTQWKAVVERAGMKVWYATSPQAKGKIERPYRWLQDRMVRRCAKEDIRTIADTRTILKDEVGRYNSHQVHSTTKEIPDARFERALREKHSVLIPFFLPSLYQSTKDVFCLIEKRVVDGYRKIQWRKYAIPVPSSVPIGAEIELHIIPDGDHPEVRLWFDNRVILVAKMQPRRQN